MSESERENIFDSNRCTLHYFDCRGLAETTRYLFAVSGQKYTDHRFPFTFGTPGDFSTVQKPEFSRAQAAGAFTEGMDKVPILEVDGVKIAQSKAIERYVAKVTGLAGGNAMEVAQIDATAEHIRDIKQAYQKVRSMEDAKEKAAAMDVWFKDTLPGHSRKLEAALPPCVTTCQNVTLAHIAIYTFYTQFFDRSDDAQKAMAQCPRLQKVCAYVKEQPGVQAWENNRPKTDF